MADDPAAVPTKRQKCSAGSNSNLYSPHFSYYRGTTPMKAALKLNTHLSHCPEQ